MRRAAWALLIAVTAVGILFLFVLPGQTWLQQRRDLRSTTADLRALNAENAQLARRIHALKNDQVIENMAREQYGLVLPGQKAYVIIPPHSNGSTAANSSGNPNLASGSRSGSGPSKVASGSAPGAARRGVRGTSASSRSFWKRLEFWK